MTIYDRIKYLREKAGMSQQELAEKVGFKTASAVNKIELGLRDLNHSKIISFAKALNVTPAFLLGWEPDELDKKVLEIYPDWFPYENNYLPTADKKKSANKTGAVKIPVLGTVVAGIPLEAVEDIIDYEEISVEMARQGEYFALQVKGDSMEPKISAGDVVIVRKQEDIDSGDIAIVLVNGDEATIKKVTKLKGGINLVPNNPAYEVMTYTNEQIESLPVNVIGKVVELRAKF